MSTPTPSPTAASRTYREDVIKVGEVTVCVFEWSGAGPPLVLLHGAGQNALWWRPTAVVPPSAWSATPLMSRPAIG